VLGRLVIYSGVMTSSMNLLSGVTLQHGLAVVPYQQTSGVGRGNNVWLSPEGCAMFSIQLHIPLASYLGQHISLLHHIATLAVVSAVRNLPGYQVRTCIGLYLDLPDSVALTFNRAGLIALAVHSVLVAGQCTSLTSLPLI
jgi:biotin--protein ligase